MTLTQILSEALVQLNLETDAQNAKAYKKKHTLYANEGAQDLALYLKLRRTDQLTLTSGALDLSALPRQCIRVLSVARGGTEYEFYYGAASGTIQVPYLTDGAVDVTYRYAPNDMTSDSDEPDIPKYLHKLLPTYIAGREHTTDDPTQQSRAKAYFELYEAGRRRARTNAGETDAFRIVNKF